MIALRDELSTTLLGTTLKPVTDLEVQAVDFICGVSR